jgi:hypothetical protein
MLLLLLVLVLLLLLLLLLLISSHASPDTPHTVMQVSGVGSCSMTQRVCDWASMLPGIPDTTARYSAAAHQLWQQLGARRPTAAPWHSCLVCATDVLLCRPARRQSGLLLPPPCSVQGSIGSALYAALKPRTSRERDHLSESVSCLCRTRMLRMPLVTTTGTATAAATQGATMLPRGYAGVV